jgi:hypothetical protein
MRIESYGVQTSLYSFFVIPLDSNETKAGAVEE